MALSKSIRFKADDIWDAPDDGKRYEVIDGQLFVTPAPVPEHQGAVGALYAHLWAYVHQQQLGKLYPAPIAVVLDEETVVQPDLVYVSRERRQIIGQRSIDGASDLVVEILSPSTRSRDRGIKQRRYAAAGIPHYWIVDPSTQALEAYRLGDQGYVLASTHGPGSTFQPTQFSGLEIPIDELWA
jgi:Uma2 family endonuclease